MKVVTWILRILSTAAFIGMCYLVYTIMDVNGVWGWAAPYEFVVTVFRLLSLFFFFLTMILMYGLSSMFMGAQGADQIAVNIYNTLVLRMWYMQPYGVDSPIVSVGEVFSRFGQDFAVILDILWNNTFLFLYFLCAGIGVALFLQSIYRLEHKFVGGAFVAIQAILLIAAAQSYIMATVSYTLPDFPNGFPLDFVAFLGGQVQIVALVSFAYLEISYQMIYSNSVGKPVEDREETLKKQLLALRQATRKQDAIEKGEKVSTTGMSRSSGAIAFSFLREAIERKVIGSQSALENLDAVADVRRLQIFVDELLSADPNARDELTAKAASPSSSYVIGSTVLGSVIRFTSVVAVSFILMSPLVLLSAMDLPPGIANSVELVQPEIVLLFLVPIVLLFPFAASVIGWITGREETEEIKLTKEEKEELKKKKKEFEQRKKDAAKARKARETARKERKKEEEADEWDKALEEIYRG
ncbi:MAG: hypothetical protein JSW61_10530 [Candidatus Thorarchaeota archaeon]|nr:MAG: hypothetical protein JSW61_10530 [Candidatus Thorarchaeota archaeon]